MKGKGGKRWAGVAFELVKQSECSNWCDGVATNQSAAIGATVWLPIRVQQLVRRRGYQSADRAQPEAVSMGLPHCVMKC